LSEAFQLASTGGCATRLRTRQRHVCNSGSASSPLSAGTAAVFRRALARCHGSRLLTLRLPFIHRPAVAFLPSPAFRKVFTSLAEAACPSRCERSFCPAFRRIFFGWLPRENRQSRSPVLMRSSNRLPSGNCDSLKLETVLSYLARFGAVSNRPLPHSSFFAFTDDARTSPEELVNPASAAELLHSASEGLGQPA